jgi:hypothetical protein
LRRIKLDNLTLFLLLCRPCTTSVTIIDTTCFGLTGHF